MLYSDNDGLFCALQKKTDSKNACGEIGESRFLNPEVLAKDSIFESETNFDKYLEKLPIFRSKSNLSLFSRENFC